jgi:hypothetical protein
MSTALRVADVFRQHWREVDRTQAIAPQAAKAARHIVQCRTRELGGHLYQCERCGSRLPVYNSCLDRHCPTCQTVRKQEWLQARQAELVPAQYFHTVFTLPHRLNALVDGNRRALLNELFAVSAWVLRRFARDPRWRLCGDLGFIALLHTWNQRLDRHFHLHCIVPGGVWRAAAKPSGGDGREDPGQWIACRGNFLFRKSSLADAFRNRYCKRLRALRRRDKLAFTGAASELADPERWERFIAELQTLRWVVWPKPTAAGPEKALDYLGRYAYRVAISDHRLLKLQDGRVTFSWRDRADGNRLKTAQLPAAGFIRRFLHHVLPSGFQKIRYYGWLSPTKRNKLLPPIREALHAPPPAPPPPETAPERILRMTGVDVRKCPCCGKSALVPVAEIPRAPP